MCLFSLQFAIDRRVLVNAVDINGEFELHDVSHDILKKQRVGGSLLYDAFKSLFNNVDKTSM